MTEAGFQDICHKLPSPVVKSIALDYVKIVAVMKSVTVESGELSQLVDALVIELAVARLGLQALPAQTSADSSQALPTQTSVDYEALMGKLPVQALKQIYGIIGRYLWDRIFYTTSVWAILERHCVSSVWSHFSPSAVPTTKNVPYHRPVHMLMSSSRPQWVLTASYLSHVSHDPFTELR